MLFTVGSGPAVLDGANIEVMSLADHATKTVVRGSTFGRYLPNGYLIYLNRSTMFAVPFDVERLEVRGTPVPVLDQIDYSSFGSGQFDFSQTGTLIYRSGGWPLRSATRSQALACHRRKESAIDLPSHQVQR